MVEMIGIPDNNSINMENQQNIANYLESDSESNSEYNESESIISEDNDDNNDNEYINQTNSELEIQFTSISTLDSSFNWNVDLIQGPQQTICEQNDYPNEAYKGFVNIIEKYGLSNKAEYRHICEALRELLMNQDLAETMQFNFEYKSQGSKGREYSEMFNCQWWETVQANIPNSAGILSLMLYSDATNCDVYGKTSRHPIFLTLGNIPWKKRNKPEGKAFVGLLPIPIAHNQIEQKDKNFQLFTKYLFHKAIATILDPLKSQYDNGVYIYINNQPKWFQ
ncbi:unnamed protein product [Rhizophagus irregularis]|nr:unnamed protein product [Rhizophagus irregularis]